MKVYYHSLAAKTFKQVKIVLNNENYLTEFDPGYFSHFDLNLNTKYLGVIIELPNLDSKEFKGEYTKSLRFVRNLRRNNYKNPVIIIQHNPELLKKLDYYFLGADAVFDSSKDIEELNARIISVLRRFIPNTRNYLRSRGISIDFRRGIFEVNGKRVALTKREFEIIKVLARKPQRTYSKDEIMEMVWAGEIIHSQGILNVYIYRIRKKLKEVNVHNFIERIKGQGYSLNLSTCV